VDTSGLVRRVAVAGVPHRAQGDRMLLYIVMILAFVATALVVGMVLTDRLQTTRALFWICAYIACLMPVALIAMVS
jgi:hypothetical protein